MVNVTCAYCGSNFVPYGDYDNFEGPVPCMACHKSTWVSVDNGMVLESKKWFFNQKTDHIRPKA